MFFLLAQETKTVTKTVVTYNTEITTAAAILVLAWVTWFLLGRYLRAKKMRRKSTRKDLKIPGNIRRIKAELSSNWLRREKSKKVHAIGIGKLAGGAPCIQIFINDRNEKIFEDSSEAVPASYRGIPLVLIEMPEAIFLAGDPAIDFSSEQYRALIREQQNVIIGGISGANSNLNGQCGTIGYFVRRKSFLPRKGDVCLLSNSHVFVDLKKGTADDDDLIMQPSPGEPADSRPIGALLDFTRIKFDTGAGDANQIDAAVAKLWKQQEYKPLIPMIGAVRGFVNRADVEVGEGARKFGRTTGFTAGHIFSVDLDIRVNYPHTGRAALFTGQFLIKPDEKIAEKFVEKGDSGSLVVDDDNYATGLIFAGGNGSLNLRDLGLETVTGNHAMLIEQVNNYGVANPISEVLAKLNLELL